MVICLSCGEGALTRVFFQARGPEGLPHWTGWQDQKHEGSNSSHFHKEYWSCAHTLSKNAKQVHICCNVTQMHSGTVTYSTAGFSLYLQFRHFFPLAHFNSCFLLEQGSFCQIKDQMSFLLQLIPLLIFDKHLTLYLQQKFQSSLLVKEALVFNSGNTKGSHL